MIYDLLCSVSLKRIFIKLLLLGLELWLSGQEHRLLFQRSRFNCQRPHGSSQWSVTAVLVGSDAPCCPRQALGRDAVHRYRHGIWCNLHCLPRSQSLTLGSGTNCLLFTLMLAVCFCVKRSLGHLHVWREPWLCLLFLQ